MPSAVVLKKDVRLDVPSVARPLAEAQGLTLNDVRLVVRKARGVFQEHLDDARARTVAELLNKLGIEALVVPQAELAKPPRQRSVIGGQLHADAFLAHTSHLRKSDPILWKDIHFMSIGIIATPQYEEFLTSSGFKELPPIWAIDDQEAKDELRRKLASRALRRDQREASEVKDRARTKPKLDKKELDSLYRDQTRGVIELWSFEPLRRYRIARHEFCYDGLGARARKTSMENFRILANDLFTYLPHALLTKISKDFLAGAELYEIIFDDEAEYERYTRWFVHQAAGPAPRPGVLAAGVGEQLLGPPCEPLDEVESIE
ncbi:MAG: hypothetical protein FD180_3709 [Planctomycetota bacterium]|nr:MAG: hypothetical protein FD180_3709 [Planctomycetota bacterium]